MRQSARRSSTCRTKNFASAAKTAYRHTDRAASRLGKRITTDHTGLSQSLSNMPKMGFLDSCQYVATRFVIAVVASLIGGLLVFILIAFGLPARFLLGYQYASDC
jgi:hypothetical protein